MNAAARDAIARIATATAALCAALLVFTASAGALARPVIPGGLTITTTHFAVTYDPTTATLATAQTVGATLETAYAHDVAGGGGTPNAGLLAPVTSPSPADGRTHLYLVAPAGGEGGGQVNRDDPPYPAGSSFIELDPAESTNAMAFRAAHEFMHVIQDAYTPNNQIFSLITESTADWAADFALPSVPPEDNNFGQPGLPLDCSYGTWPSTGGTACGNGYWQWLFIERVTEDWGAGFVGALWSHANVCYANPTATGCASISDTAAFDRAVLDYQIGISSAHASNLRIAFARYADLIWDPTAWSTPAVGAIMHNYDYYNAIPASDHANLSPSHPDSGTQTVTIDHLAAHYVTVRNIGASGPGDQLKVTVTQPSSILAAPEVLADTGPSGARTRTTLTGSGGTYTATIPFDPATTGDAVIALVNDTDAPPLDGQTFTWRAQLLSGTPVTPPAPDTIAGAQPVWLGQSASVNNSYATGLSDTESECVGVGPSGVTEPVGATRGVWFRFVAPGNGVYTFDSTASNFTAEIAVAVPTSAGYGCLTWGTEGPYDSRALGGSMSRGEVADIYLGRSIEAIGDGDSANLNVTGPAGAPFAPVISSPADNSTNTTGTVVLSGTSEPGATVYVYDGSTDVGQTTASANSSATWSLTLTGVANGAHVYGAFASNSSGTSPTESNIVHVTVAVPTPVSTQAPHVSGGNTIGSMLSVANGSWTNAPTSYAYRWWRCVPTSGGGCTPAVISGATLSTYVIAADDASAILYAQVQANRGPLSSAWATSDNSITVASNTSTSTSATSVASSSASGTGGSGGSATTVTTSTQTSATGTGGVLGVSTTTSALRISSLTITPASFHTARRGGSVATAGGAKVSFVLSRGGWVTFVVRAAVPGRRSVTGACVAPNRRNRPHGACTRYLPVPGGFRFPAAGKALITQGSFRFTGRLAGAALTAGRYELVAVARDAAGTASPAVTAAFRILA